jgi:hypothetical protein
MACCSYWNDKVPPPPKKKCVDEQCSICSINFYILNGTIRCTCCHIAVCVNCYHEHDSRKCDHGDDNESDDDSDDEESDSESGIETDCESVNSDS